MTLSQPSEFPEKGMLKTDKEGAHRVGDAGELSETGTSDVKDATPGNGKKGVRE